MAKEIMEINDRRTECSCGYKNTPNHISRCNYCGLALLSIINNSMRDLDIALSSIGIDVFGSGVHVEELPDNTIVVEISDVYSGFIPKISKYFKILHAGSSITLGYRKLILKHLPLNT